MIQDEPDPIIKEEPDNRIKVAQVITRMDWGGSPDIVRLICDLCNTDKFNVTLVSGSSSHLSLETTRFLDKISDRAVSLYQLERNINPFNDLITFIRLYRLFRREKFDIVHTHTAKAGALGRIAARLAGVKHIIHTPHGHNFYGYFGPVGTKIVIFIEKLLTNFTDKIMALTELERKDFLSFGVSPITKIVIINSGIELTKFRYINVDPVKVRRQFSIKPDENLVGMIGRLEFVKGPQVLIEAAKTVLAKNPNTKILIVGEGSLRGQLESRCNQLRINDKVIFAGWREDIPQLLSILDIIVLPSLNEAVGRILIEAGAVGIPAVASYVGGIPEIIKDNATGILVPPKSPDDLARAIITLLNDPARRKKMGKEAQIRTDNKFSAYRMVSKIYDLYRELMQNAKK